MEHEEDVTKNYSSDESSGSLYGVNVDLHGGSSESLSTKPRRRDVDRSGTQVTPTSASVQKLSDTMPAFSGPEFQEMVIRALFQATGALMGPSSGILQHAGETSTPIAVDNIVQSDPISKWNENTFMKAEARRNRKPEMTHISTGEDSNSEEDFPLPENATPEEKALRTRRLNRWRGKRAKDLSNNRKAVKKHPYVIGVDMMGRPKGIHRHQWKAAIRGQCG